MSWVIRGGDEFRERTAGGDGFRERTVGGDELRERTAGGDRFRERTVGGDELRERTAAATGLGSGVWGRAAWGLFPEVEAAELVDVFHLSEFQVVAEVEAEVFFFGGGDADGVVGRGDLIYIGPEEKAAIGEAGNGDAGMVKGEYLV